MKKLVLQEKQRCITCHNYEPTANRELGYCIELLKLLQVMEITKENKCKKYKSCNDAPKVITMQEN